jgi:hypothetical protein
MLSDKKAFIKTLLLPIKEKATELLLETGKNYLKWASSMKSGW